MIRKSKSDNRFFLDNQIIDDRMIPSIGNAAMLVYICLCRHANYQTQICYPSQKKLASELKMSVRNVRRGINKLIVHKMIEKRQIGKKCNNRYFLLDRTVWTKETYANESTNNGTDCPAIADTNGPVHSNETQLKEIKEKSVSSSNEERKTISSNKDKWSYISFLRWLYNTGKLEDRILLYYINAKDFYFPNETGAKKFYEENISDAKALIGYKTQTIANTFGYLENECKWMKRWTLGSVLKFINDIDVGNIPLKGQYKYSTEEMIEIIQREDSKEVY